MIHATDRRPHLLQAISSSLSPTTTSTTSAVPSSQSKEEVPRTAQAAEDNIANLKLDALGEFITLDTNFFIDKGSWHELFHSVKGRSNFSQRLDTLHHRARPFLQRYAKHGVPVLLHSKPWTLLEKDKAMQRGNHPSTKAFAEFIRSEMTDMRSKGMFIVLPYHLVRPLAPLRISPLGCVPQRERRPRIINDYTFSNINQDTMKLAPPEAMQWGRTLNRVLWYIYTADSRQGPVLMSKTDLSDGFYQLHLTPTGALKLAVPFDVDDQTQYVAIPTRLPMGWTESPPAFSAVTETIADVINERLESSQDMPPSHSLEGLASQPVPLATPLEADEYPVTETGPVRPPLAYVDVYVDDFIKIAQGWFNAMRVRRHTYHAIDEVFRPNDSTDVNRKAPISLKKLEKGDDAWSTTKTILGWTINSATKTISLPEHRRERLLELLGTMVKRRRASRKEWHQLLGELRSMALALPGSLGCFSFLQEALAGNRQRIKITPRIRDQLKDLLWLAERLAERPTHLAEVVPTPPTYFGTMDAAKQGMGGVWFPPSTSDPLAVRYPRSSQLVNPVLWRARFPHDVQRLLVSSDNPRGTVTNSDLELAGSIAQDDILAQALPGQHHLSTCTFSDNTPAVSWKSKGSTTTTGPAAYLLQQYALHRRHYRYQNELNFLPGSLNSMADDCSRLWHLTDNQLLTHFNHHYPQQKSWEMHHLRPEMHSALISSLLKTRSQPELYLPATEKLSKRGPSGLRSAHPSMSTPTYRRWPTLSSFYRPSVSGGEMDASLPVKSLTRLALWRMRSGLSARNFPAWGPRTLG